VAAALLLLLLIRSPYLTETRQHLSQTHCHPGLEPHLLH
jgi:hypothetical protein